MINQSKNKNIHLNTKHILKLLNIFLIYKESERGEEKSPRAALLL